MKNFSQILFQEMLDAKGVSKKQVASAINVDLSSVYRYASGEYKPSAKHFKLLVAFFKCEPDDLLEYTFRFDDELPFTYFEQKLISQLMKLTPERRTKVTNYADAMAYCKAKQNPI